eukprot:CAMPEP_0171461268 /NCGR_PEP_ID=MMETSP0945-20130129/5785_1 /TAXON_ID=109269 /ORGANISM="Vaucheria litorea, Strain CCMP2940" /LENGTH=545 /DNA_ID=CAMNT_0011987583 /DNA_START=14 /DNA_END=1651 /DNA_ORIENTATION=+
MPQRCLTTPLDIRVHGKVPKESEHILSPDSLRFLGYLHQRFEQRRQMILAARVARQCEFDAGIDPCFRPETKHVRDDPDWKVRPPPKDLLDRRVEITGPVDRKMVINGLNSGASTYMADFEDSTSPTWDNILDGQVNLFDATRGTISYTNPANGKKYSLNEKQAVLIVRPRGWHLDEAHVTVNGQAMSGSLFDFGLFFFHNHHPLLIKGSGPYFYLPKIENHLEARLWNDVFVGAQDYVGLTHGTIRATMLLETITAAFEMEELLFELREHSVGLNCGRWDYIFSYIKKMQSRPERVTPDRKYITMDSPFMKAYVQLLIHTCHKRGAHAMGGMAAQIPVKNDPKLQEKAMSQVKADKLREVKAGHDGTWVAHPALVTIALDVFNEHMPKPNQVDKIPPCNVTEKELLCAPVNVSISNEGLQENIDVCLEYVGSWLKGTGCIPIFHKMEDAATAEISRAQVWQWVRHEPVTTDTSTKITKEYVKDLVNKRGKHFQVESEKVGDMESKRAFIVATKLVREMMTKPQIDQFLTSVVYAHIVNVNASRL